MKIQKNTLLQLHKLYRDHLAQQLSELTDVSFEECKELLFGFRPNPKHFKAFCDSQKNKVLIP